MHKAAPVPDAARPAAADQDAADHDSLFARVRTGDREAFRLLFRQHQRSVYWAAFSVLGTRGDSEEVLQDAFLTLWNKRVTIDLVGESALPWLITTARYLALNRRRAESRRPRDSLDAGLEIADDAPTPESVAIGNEALRRIRTVMASRPDVDQRIFELCLLDDLSYEQAARRLGISHATVRNRLSRLKGRLRTELSLLKGEPSHAPE